MHIFSILAQTITINQFYFKGEVNMKKGFSGEKMALIFISIILLGTLLFSIYTFFTGNSSLINNDTFVNLDKNGENQTPSHPNSAHKDNEQTSSAPLTEQEKNEVNVDPNVVTPSDGQHPKEEKTVEPVQIATYTTTIYDSDTNRIDNISLAISKLNGAVIKKGEEFSFNATIGPMDESQGFKKALGFDGQGNKIEISGGGICQISSTLYNSALIAGLEVTERHPHSHRVYYVPQDKDATILYGTYDLKFKNTTDQDIKIEATNDTANVTVNLVKI